MKNLCQLASEFELEQSHLNLSQVHASKFPVPISFQLTITSDSVWPGLKFSLACHRFNVFPRLTSVACFPAFDPGFIFSHGRNRLHVFLRLTRVEFFPRFTPLACFPALGISCMFSRVWNQVVPFTCFLSRLTPAECFPALDRACIIIFPRLIPVACFQRLARSA